MVHHNGLEGGSPVAVVRHLAGHHDGQEVVDSRRVVVLGLLGVDSLKVDSLVAAHHRSGLLVEGSSLVVVGRPVAEHRDQVVGNNQVVDNRLVVDSQVALAHNLAAAEQLFSCGRAEQWRARLAPPSLIHPWTSSNRKALYLAASSGR